ncbi:MAG TPA: DUF4893 domain-containing protein [Allosphingosinicella sp.]|nr:DUF4893 domain-containing protein [Allosphingosinicella sp.]
MTKGFIPVISCVLLLGACRTVPPDAPAPPIVAQVAPGWRGEATPEDEARIQSLQVAWQRALDNAKKAGFRKQIAEEGKLLDPAAALPFPTPSPGSYMCRAVKLRPPAGGIRAFAAYKPFFCFVGADADRLFFTKQTGTERPSGYLWESENSKALIFLGSMAVGADKAIPYGGDRRRDLAGVLERIGPLRFRLVLPRDVVQGHVDIFELLPAPVQNED